MESFFFFFIESVLFMVNEVGLSGILGVEDHLVPISCSVQESHLRLLRTGYPDTAGTSSARGALCIRRQHDSVLKEILLGSGTSLGPILPIGPVLHRE